VLVFFGHKQFFLNDQEIKLKYRLMNTVLLLLWDKWLKWLSKKNGLDVF